MDSGGTDSEATVEGGSWSLGIPFYWADSPNSVYLMYEVGGVNHYYSDYMGFEANVVQRRQGWTLGYMGQPNNGNISFSMLQYGVGQRQTYSAVSIQLGWVVGSTD